MLMCSVLGSHRDSKACCFTAILAGMQVVTKRKLSTMLEATMGPPPFLQNLDPNTWEVRACTPAACLARQLAPLMRSVRFVMAWLIYTLPCRLAVHRWSSPSRERRSVQQMSQSSWRAFSCCRMAQICPLQPAVHRPCTLNSRLSWQGRRHRTRVLPAARISRQSSAACWRLSRTWKLTRPALTHLAICNPMQVSTPELLVLLLVVARDAVLYACKIVSHLPGDLIHCIDLCPCTLCISAA